MRYYSNLPIIDTFEFHHIITNKYEIDYSYSLDRLGVKKKHFLWSNKILRYYKDTPYIMVIDGSLAFRVLPHFDEFISCHKFMTDKIVNQKIERLLKLRAFM